MILLICGSGWVFGLEWCRGGAWREASSFCPTWQPGCRFLCAEASGGAFVTPHVRDFQVLQIPRLKNKGINLEVRGIMDSQQMLLAAEGDKLCLDTWGDDLLSKVRCATG